MAIRVLLADDHRLLREGLRVLLEASDGIEVVADAADGEEAVAAAARFSPDVAVLDIAMPRLDGLKAAGIIAALHPETRVVILSMHISPEYVEQAFAAGAAAYLAKDAAADELEAAIRAVAGGERYVSLATDRPAPPPRPPVRPPDEGLGRLTQRQSQVLRLIAGGRTTKVIARDLQISTKTVETHRAALMEKLDIHDIAGLVRYAVRHGLVSAER